jgi:hypothetical protein
MVSPNVDNLLKLANSLSLAEREQFLQLLRSQPAHEQPAQSDDAWMRAFQYTLDNAVTVGQDVDDSRESIYRGCGE